MSHSGQGNGPTPILSHVGFAGAVARFCQRSYAADYIALGFLALGWALVSGNCTTSRSLTLANLPLLLLEQIQSINPFHRMFSLDNKAIQFPFAVHERVPVCTTPEISIRTRCTHPISSVVDHIRWRDTLSDYPRLVRHDAPRGTKDSSDGARAAGSPGADLFPDGRGQECGGKTSSGSAFAV